MTHYEISTNPSPQVKELHYLDQVKVLNLHEIEELLTDDFGQSTRPLSLGLPSRTKEDLAFLQGFADQLGGRALEVIISYPRLPCVSCTSDGVVSTDYNLRHH